MQDELRLLAAERDREQQALERFEAALDVADEDADLWGGDEPTDESSTDAEEATSEDQLELPLETADDGADDADLIAQEVPEETPVTEEPAKPARKRRSAF